MTAPPVYALYSKTCGHVAAVTGVRSQAEVTAKTLITAGQSQWRVRVATDADLLNLLQPRSACTGCHVDPPAPDPAGDMAILPMACINEPAAVEDAKRHTHDELIRMLGGNRLSGIRWLIRTGREECEQLMRSMYPDAKPHTDEYLAFFDQYPDTCALVVATCETTPPPEGSS